MNKITNIELSNTFCKYFNINNKCKLGDWVMHIEDLKCKTCFNLHTLLHIDPYCVDHG